MVKAPGNNVQYRQSVTRVTVDIMGELHQHRMNRAKSIDQVVAVFEMDLSADFIPLVRVSCRHSCA